MFLAAELSGRTIDLDLACIETAATAAAALGLEGYLSLNLSPRTLESREFGAGHLVRVLERAGINPSHVVVEITERESIEDIDRLRQNVEALRLRGMGIAADDVGAGNAGLRLLSQDRFDLVKIDLSLIHGGVHQATSLEVIRSIRDLAARTRSSVVAEGVETVDQLRICRDLGLAAAQGYLLGRPEAEPPREAIDLASILDSDPWNILRRERVPA